jgi:hypothetical protein
VPQCRSGDDIGKQLVLDLRNAIFQGEFFLFKPLDQKLVSRGVSFKGHDFAIELAMLRSQAHQFVSELALVAPFHRKTYPTARPGARPIAAFWKIALNLATGKSTIGDNVSNRMLFLEKVLMAPIPACGAM